MNRRFSFYATCLIIVLLSFISHDVAAAIDVDTDGKTITAKLTRRTYLHEHPRVQAKKPPTRKTRHVRRVVAPRRWYDPKLSSFINGTGPLHPTYATMTNLLNHKPPKHPTTRHPTPTPAPPPITTTTISTYLAHHTLPPATFHIQPPHGPILTNKPTNAYYTTTHHTLTLTLNTTPITIHAQALAHTIDWGDTTTTHTTSHGAPWPTMGITHTYTTPPAHDPATPSRVTITSHTTWEVTYLDPTTGIWHTLPTTLTTQDAHTTRELATHTTYLYDPTHAPPQEHR
ncbi:MAG: hypothetical protein Q4B10_03260 [Actinomycetaceae bacterium]|nr:hypothetical protein [Actinomycetaceae bacterium]